MHIHPDIFVFAVLLLIVLGIATQVVYNRVKKKPFNLKSTRALKHVGQISLGLGILLQLTELSTALEHVTSSLTREQIAMGLRSTLFSTIHGLIVYIIAMTLYTTLKLTEKKETI